MSYLPIKSFLSLCACVAFTLPLHAVECPNNFVPAMTKVRLNQPSRIVQFECKHEVRYEYFKSMPEIDLKVTTWASENDVLPVQKILSYAKNGKKTALQSYNAEGLLEREEHYDLEGRVVFKYFKETSKVEELNQDERVTRSCVFDLQNLTAYEEIGINPNLGTFRVSWTVSDEQNPMGLKGELELRSEENILLKKSTAPGLTEGHLLSEGNKTLFELCMAPASQKFIVGAFNHQNQVYLFNNVNLTVFFQNPALKKEELKNFLKPYKPGEVKPAESTQIDGLLREPNSVPKKKGLK